jgi:hypothetical protein
MEILPYEVVISRPHFAIIPGEHNADHEKVEVGAPSQKSLTSLKRKNPAIDLVAFTRRVTMVSEGLVLLNATIKKEKPKGHQKLPSKEVQKLSIGNSSKSL